MGVDLRGMEGERSVEDGMFACFFLVKRVEMRGVRRQGRGRNLWGAG
jgi:hypothetical protein